MFIRTEARQKITYFFCLSGSCPHECLNGAFCSKTGTCDCQIFQALGTRCQIGKFQGCLRELQVEGNFKVNLLCKCSATGDWDNHITY